MTQGWGVKASLLVLHYHFFRLFLFICHISYNLLVEWLLISLRFYSLFATKLDTKMNVIQQIVI